MLKLIYSDYPQDKVTRVKGKYLKLQQALINFSFDKRMKFTVTGLYPDNKKYTVVNKSDIYGDNLLFAIKPYPNYINHYWVIIINVENQQFMEFVAESLDIEYDIQRYIDYYQSGQDITPINSCDSFRTGIFNFIMYSQLNEQFNNGEPFVTDISEIDRIWFEQMRGESFLK